ncbi:MAG TPA: hypothetical protein VLU25_15120 [Acidobacteriota bacterium]|nr:hypothetical protein [Acidobacteriota bacterium]
MTNLRIMLYLLLMPATTGWGLSQDSEDRQPDCTSKETRIMLPCDTHSQLENWPEQEAVKELLGWLAESNPCTRNDVSSEDLNEAVQLFVALPKEKTVAGSPQEKPIIERTLTDIDYQFFLFTGREDVVPAPGRERTPPSHKAAPQRAAQLSTSDEGAPLAAASLVDIVFIPRFEPSEKDGWYYVIPVTAVPSRILDTPAFGRDQGVNLRRIRSELEPTGLRFLALMQSHFANKLAGGGQGTRLTERLEDTGQGDEAMPEQDEIVSGMLGKGLPYRIEELAYFDLQVQQEGDSGGDPEEVGFRQAYYPILARFEKFWDEVEDRRIRLGSLSQKALSKP